MLDLLAKESENPQAAEAVALFCYQAKKSFGALIAVLGGLVTLIFTAGIGESAPNPLAHLRRRGILRHPPAFRSQRTKRSNHFAQQ